MKNLKRIMFFAIAIFTLAMSTSCSSDDSKDDENENPTTDFIKFKYKEKEYTYESEFTSSESINISGMEGIDDTYKKVSLWLPLNATVGTHNVVFDSSDLTTTYQANFSFMPEFNNANATSGTITITKVTERIEGTFNFSGTQGDKTFTVTEGSFSVERF
jgi:hypothetical protein